jgi:hypothetical protein
MKLDTPTTSNAHLGGEKWQLSQRDSRFVGNSRELSFSCPGGLHLALMLRAERTWSSGNGRRKTAKTC